MSASPLVAILLVAASVQQTDTTGGSAGPAVGGHEDAVIGDQGASDDAMVGGSDDAAITGEDARDDAIFGGTESLDDVFVGGDDRADAAFGDQEGRDDAAFGDDVGRDDAMLGNEEADLEGRLSAALDEQQNWLDLGGYFYLRLDHNIQEEPAAGESPLTSANLADIYLDGRPNDRVRGYLRGRLRYDPTVTNGELDAFGNEQVSTEVLLDQFWLKLDILHVVYVTVGKQPVRWGTGRFWNPTDFLNQQKIDPLTLFDERRGVGLVKFHFPIESLNWNLYAVANVDGADVPDRVGGALRAEMLFGETEVALTYAKRKRSPHQLGVDISSGVWLFDVRAEVAALHGVRTPVYTETYPAYVDRLTADLVAELTSPSPDLANVDISPLTESRRDEWILQGVGAVELTVRYSDQDTVTFGVEYFYNDAGYESADYYPLLQLNGHFVPFYAGRHYLGGYVHLPQPGLWNDTSFTASLLSNLSDESYLARLDVQVRVLTFLDVNLYTSVHFGEIGELNYELFQEPVDVPPDFADEVSQLDPALQRIVTEGIQTKRTVADVGVALRVSF